MDVAREDPATAPGRICPTRYRYRASALRSARVVDADTLYIVGGLYGNVEALHEILAMKAAEERRGIRITIVFNGDFNWFDVDERDFREINETVLGHVASTGNVEAELDGEGDIGCGCAYPAYVSQATVECSNAIMDRLRDSASRQGDLTGRLAELPMYLVARVAGERIGILHGDPESLAGWRFAVENLMPLDLALRAQLGCGTRDAVTTESDVARYFEQAGVRIFACTHTCLPFMQDFILGGGVGVVVNNGSAGMGNFSRDRRGLVTRISADPRPPVATLYGRSAHGLRIDALPVAYDHPAWCRRFLASWPQGSPAHRSYYERIARGPRFRLAQAMRLGAALSQCERAARRDALPHDRVLG